MKVPSKYTAASRPGGFALRRSHRARGFRSLQTAHVLPVFVLFVRVTTRQRAEKLHGDLYANLTEVVLRAAAMTWDGGTPSMWLRDTPTVSSCSDWPLPYRAATIGRCDFEWLRFLVSPVRGEENWSPSGFIEAQAHAIGRTQDRLHQIPTSRQRATPYDVQSVRDYGCKPQDCSRWGCMARRSDLVSGDRAKDPKMGWIACLRSEMTILVGASATTVPLREGRLSLKLFRKVFS